ncbi:MAG: response regulator [Alphaproteobacteria bacterium]|nr:response regulator [Alphaproteobacteria bacterium]
MVGSTAPAILVVDDEPEIRGLLLDCLEIHGYRVVAAHDPAAAMSILATQADIHLMLTDVVMPGGMNGFELGRAARATRPDLAVLYMSGYALGEAGGDPAAPAPPILQKPFRFEHVLDAIAAALMPAGVMPLRHRGPAA